MKAGIIGAGYFAHFHADAWNRMPQIQIGGIADLDIKKASSLAANFGGTAFRSFTEMIDQIKPDFLDIITPPSTHLPLLQELLPRGIPIIIQKPLAPDFSESKSIIDLCKESDTRVMVHENWRFQPWYREAKKWINKGLIGDRLHQLSFTMRMGDGWPKDAYLSRQPYFRTMPRLLIHETGIHFIDTFRYLFGEVESVYSKLQKLNPNIDGEDAGILILNHKNGAISILNGNRFNESNKENPRYTFGHMLLEGNKGSMRLYEDGTLTFQSLGNQEENIEYNPSKIGFTGDSVYRTQAHFISSLRENLPFETAPQDYFKSLEIQEALYASNKKNQVIHL